MEALASSLKGLANYPTTQGMPALRQAIAAWCRRRYGLELNPETEILPVNGSREALFSFAQTVIDPGRGHVPLVVSPNPFYQIYEGRAYLAGAEPRFLNNLPENDFAFDYASLTEEEWARVQLFYVCSPGNPTGKVLSLDDWKTLFALSDNTASSSPPTSAIRKSISTKPTRRSAACRRRKLLGRSNERLVMFSSLSKRSNVPGMRSGLRRRRRRHPEEIPALPHLPRLRHGAPGADRLRRRLERRGACPRQPQPVPRKIRRLHAADRRSARHRHARRQLLPVGEDADRRHRVRPRSARTL
jgi:hypothetical protein